MKGSSKHIHVNQRIGKDYLDGGASIVHYENNFVMIKNRKISRIEELSHQE